MMKLSDKIIKLRKANGWSQEDLAERLNISRQAISRWENETALPDAGNILQLSKLFGVTADYLLNEDYTGDEDIPCVKEAHGSLDSQKKSFSLVASIAFLIGAISWVCAAIDYLCVGYVILAVANAVLSGVNFYLYSKNKKQQ